MKNNIKLKDRFKSWLLTLGIASVFGLAALGVNAANSYHKTSAYSIDDTYTLEFTPMSEDDDSISYDFYLLKSYFLTQFEDDDTIELKAISSYKETFVYSNEGTYLLLHGSDTNLYFTNEGLYWSNGFDTIDDLEGPCYFVYSSPDYLGYQSLRVYAISYNAPQESGNFVSALTDFMSLIGGGIVQLAQSVGAGVVSFASGLFLDSGHLSILGGIIGIFCGIALAVGITSKVYTWVSTLGN